MRDRDCLDDDELRRLANSTEAATGDEPLIAHLDRCEGCRERLESLAGAPEIDGATWSELASPPPSSATLIATIDRLSSRAVAAELCGSTRYGDLDRWIDSSTPAEPPTLDGYVLLDCVGRGGMGIVFRALAPDQERVVAVKAMTPELARDERSRARFLREAKALATVRHPNVVALHAVSEVDGLPYLAMEYIEGESLECLMKSGRPTPPDEVARIGAEIAAGLSACHEQGVIHRDIKPSNVLLSDADGSVKITDFGLAAVASTPTLTQNGYLSGTPDYVAPERLTIGSESDERSDLFSLGCLLYAMATGEEPFGGETPLITLHRISTEKPAALRQKNPAIPAQLAKTIASLMAKRPQDRPESAEQARVMLLGDRSKSARPLIGRRAGLAAAVVGILAVVIAAFNFSSSPATPTRLVTVTTANELEDAVRSIPNGGFIEIDTDEVLAVRPLNVVGKSVSIAAANGRNPVLNLLIREGDDAPDYLLRASGGELRLFGLDLRDELHAERHDEADVEATVDAEEYGLLSIRDAAFTAEGCRFETRSFGSCVELASCPSARMSDCRMFAPGGSALHWSADEGDRLVLDDCVSASVSALLVTAKGDAILEWTRSTALVRVAAIELTHSSGALFANVSGSLIQSKEALVTTTHQPESRAEFEKLLVWRGDSNRIRGQGVHFADEDRIPGWARAVSSWAAEDKKSSYGVRIFDRSHEAAEAALARGARVESLLGQRDVSQ